MTKKEIRAAIDAEVERLRAGRPFFLDAWGWSDEFTKADFVSHVQDSGRRVYAVQSRLGGSTTNLSFVMAKNQNSALEAAAEWFFAKYYPDDPEPYGADGPVHAYQVLP